MMLFCAVFIIVRFGITIDRPGEPRVQPGLLLFIIPGVLAGLTAREAPLVVALGGALLAIPICLLLSFSHFVVDSGFWQELAWYASALFWCGSGALVIMLWRAMFGTRPHS
ncbi:inner membrane protein YbjM [Pantoea sp. B65]